MRKIHKKFSFFPESTRRRNEQRIYIFRSFLEIFFIWGGGFMLPPARTRQSFKTLLGSTWKAFLSKLGFLFSFSYFRLINSAPTKTCRCKLNSSNILHLCWAHYEFQGKSHKREMSKKSFNPSDSFYFDSGVNKKSNWLQTCCSKCGSRMLR